MSQTNTKVATIISNLEKLTNWTAIQTSKKGQRIGHYAAQIAKGLHAKIKAHVQDSKQNELTMAHCLHWGDKIQHLHDMVRWSKHRTDVPTEVAELLDTLLKESNNLRTHILNQPVTNITGYLAEYTKAGDPIIRGPARELLAEIRQQKAKNGTNELDISNCLYLVMKIREIYDNNKQHALLDNMLSESKTLQSLGYVGKQSLNIYLVHFIIIYYILSRNQN